MPTQMYWSIIVDLEECGKITLKNEQRNKINKLTVILILSTLGIECL